MSTNEVDVAGRIGPLAWRIYVPAAPSTLARRHRAQHVGATTPPPSTLARRQDQSHLILGVASTSHLPTHGVTAVSLIGHVR